MRHMVNDTTRIVLSDMRKSMVGKSRFFLHAPLQENYSSTFLYETVFSFHSHPIDYDVMYRVAGQANGSKVKKNELSATSF